MFNSKLVRVLGLIGFTLFCMSIGGYLFAQSPSAQQNTAGVAAVASTVQSNLGAIAKLLTAAAYVAGFGFGIGAIVKFKAHKDNPTQVPIGQPIALLFVAAALMVAPYVFQSSGETLYGANVSGTGVTGTAQWS